MTWTILQADARQIPLADKSVQCVVTSPPYWGLRDYGTARWEGGDEGCDHKQTIARHDGNRGNHNGGLPGFHGGDLTNGDKGAMNYRDQCGKCGATRIDSQIGLEKSPEEYVAKIVAVFAEVWRVLRDDGTCWVNLGDSYNANQGNGFDTHKDGGERKTAAATYRIKWGKPKDLVGIPWRVAFALQTNGAASPETMLAVDRIRNALLADYDDWEQVPDKTRSVIEQLDREWHDAHRGGWYLRSDIIWSKPNPMPESVTDRPTKAHEYIFLLTKNQRYYFDQDAVREAFDGELHAPGNKADNGRLTSSMGHFEEPNRVWGNVAGRNIRTVWEIATQPYPEAHFATFPEEIAVRCIKAGTSEKGACAECGVAWARVTEHIGATVKSPDSDYGYGAGRNDGGRSQLIGAQSKTLGWQPTCKHDAPTVPCIVLDPFSGAGTVPLVADKLGRRGIGLELKADYCRMASRRCYDDAPLLVGV